MTAVATEATPLTDRQAEVFALIYSAAAGNRPSPTIREIGEAVGVRSPNGALSLIRPLIRKGYVAYDRNRSRSYRPLRTPDGRPIVGFRPVIAGEEG
jgi:repressor LexA